MPNTPTDSAFIELEGALQGSPQFLMKYREVQMHRQRLEMAADSTAASLEAINEEPAYSPGKADRTKLALNIFDSVDKESTRGLENSFSALREELERAALPDLTPSSDSTGRQLIRQEIDAQMANAGHLTVSTLMRLAQDPRYASEVAAYGPSLLAKAGMPERIPELQRGILKVAPTYTPSARTAQNALRKLDLAQGHIGSVLFTARQRVEATQPRKRAGYVGNVIGNRIV